jgi:hypothetical protein
MRAKNSETTKVTHQNGTEPRASATRTVQLTSITVGHRHRKAMGDLQSLADSIAGEGLLQPIGITEDCRLVFGERRLRACRDILGRTEIEARVVNVSSIVAGERAENEIRKAFTVSERVAIGQTIEKGLGNRRGQRTDKRLPGNFPEVEHGRETRQIAARRAGFGNETTYRHAKQVVACGVPELVQAVDNGEIAVSAAARIAAKPAEEQCEVLTSTRQEAGRSSSKTTAVVSPAPRKSAFPGIRTACARDAKNVCDLDTAMRHFGELVEPIYRTADHLVRDRIKREILRLFAQMDEDATVTAQALAGRSEPD